MKNFSFAIVVFFAAFSYAAVSGVDVRKANVEIANKLLSTITTCGDKIWPGYDLKNMNVVLLDNSAEPLIAVSTKENKIFSIERIKIPNNPSWYSFFKIDEQAWMSINTEQLHKDVETDTQAQVIDRAYGLAVHESFHHTTQKKWKRISGPRGTFVPIKWEPRLYRAMIFGNLMSAYANKESTLQDLQRAKYWYEKWSTEFPEEVQSTTDGYEGTARYSDRVALALARLGCEATEAQISSYLIDLPATSGAGAFSGNRFSLDSEGYGMGSLASLILRRDQAQPDWQNLISQGKTPLEILMKDINSLFQDVDEAFKLKLAETQRKEQAGVDQYLADTYRLLNDKESYFVSVPFSWWDNTASVSFFEFYIDNTLNMSFSVLGEALNFLSPDKLSQLKSTEAAVYLDLLNQKNPCHDASWIFVVAKNQTATDSNNRLKLDAEHFKGEVTGELIKDSNGKNWFCAGK